VTDSTQATLPDDQTRGTREPDAICAGAVELARVAAAMVGGGDVGDHLGCSAVADGPPEVNEGGYVVDHYFACRHPGYRGWRWCVTVARPDGDRVVSVDEVALLPTDDAVLAPAWVPWAERLRPDDLGPGDLLPTAADDPRLVPSFAAADIDLDDDDVLAAARYELGLGRARVLSRWGREEAADRWYAGESGPDAPIAKQAPGRCGTCGFYLPLAGSLGRAFGACGNENVPDDARVVSADHGCGAHSEAVDAPGLAQADAPAPLVDDNRYEYEVLPS